MNYVEQRPAQETDSRESQEALPNINSNNQENLVEDAIFSLKSPSGRIIEVFPSCVSGNCKCEFFLEGVKNQLRACRFAGIIFSDVTLTESYSGLLWHDTDGFPIVDSPVDS